MRIIKADALPDPVSTEHVFKTSLMLETIEGYVVHIHACKQYGNTDCIYPDGITQEELEEICPS